RRDLVLDEVVFRAGTTNPRPAFPGRVDDVEIVWNQCDEVVDVSVPIAVEGSSEKHSRVVVEKHEAHVVESSNFGCTRREVATQQLEERTQPLRAARRQRNNDGQLRALAQTRADAAGAFDWRWRLRNL